MKTQLIAGVALPIWLAAAPGFAQTVGNEVWIGQTGDTNTIIIIQEGEGNRAGADNVAHLLNQTGEFNSLSIDQFGWSTSVGSTALGAGRPSGVNQVGDFNEISISQSNTELSRQDSNTVGAIYQQSSGARTAVANVATVVQSEAGASILGAGHFVGSIQQVNTGAATRANQITIDQAGRGVGLGHSVGSVSQSGWANVVRIAQWEQSHAVAAALQFGATNFIEIDQSNDRNNFVGSSEQRGSTNSMKIQQSGSRNAIEEILQSNEILRAGAGNRVMVMVSGEDNGGTGRGGVGEFLAAATLKLSGVAQGIVVQLGDDNDVGLTILQGVLTKAGFMQIGNGNGVLSSISGASGVTAFGNEIAVFQNGDDNNVVHEVVGSNNVLAVSQDGDRNRATVIQTGEFNLVDLTITGFGTNSPAGGGFSALAKSAATGAGLSPGLITQTGVLHIVSLDVNGPYNLFGISQSGNYNRIEAYMSGTGNQLVGLQEGSGNASLSHQYGHGNVLVVRQ